MLLTRWFYFKNIQFHVFQVSASDADEGENADLYYICVSYLAPVSDGCSVVTVSNTTGDVRLQRSLVISQMYFALVEACDSLADISQR